MEEKISTQTKICKELEKILAPYLKNMIDEDTWSKIVFSIKTVFNTQKCEGNVLTFSEICHNRCADYIIEYNISFIEGWFMYCHLRKGHLKINFVPKEF